MSMNQNNLTDLSDLQLSEQELFTRINHNELESEKITAPRYSYWKSVFRVFFRKRINIVALVLLAIILIFAYVYPMVSNFDRFENLMAGQTAVHLSPSEAMARNGATIHWIAGSGASGESTFDSVWAGSKISLSLAFICAAVNMTIGVLLGAVWGFSKRMDIIMTEVYNIIGNVPYILRVSVMILILSAGFWTMVLALTIVGWLFIAHFIRTQVIIIRDREYNLASRCLGTSIFRIAMKNVLPFMTSVIVTLIAEEIPSYISAEVFLSYIGMGMTEKSLGNLIAKAEANMLVPGWSIEFWFPVALTAVITVVIYLAGQNLGDASDPRTHM